jgi:hypothetical protein
MTMPVSHIACEGPPSAQAQRGTLLVTGLTVLLCLADLGFIDARAVAQEFVGMYRWRTAKGPIVLTLEEEKAAKPGWAFKECANGCPVMIVIPAGKFIMGSPEDELNRQTYRVVRGGSWRNESEQVRAAVRFKRNINVRFDTLGFRVARKMEP